MVPYLEFCAKFYQYRPPNVWLILMSRPDAIHLTGYNAWKKTRRYVRLGKKGIAILTSMLYREDSDDEESLKGLLGFNLRSR